MGIYHCMRLNLEFAIDSSKKLAIGRINTKLATMININKRETKSVSFV